MASGPAADPVAGSSVTPRAAGANIRLRQRRPEPAEQYTATPANPATPGPGCPQLIQATATSGGEGLPPPLESTAPHGARSRFCRYSRSTSTDESQPLDRQDHYTEARTPPSGPIALRRAGATAGGPFGRSCPLVRVRLRRAPMVTVPRQPTHSSEIQTAAAPAAIRPVAIAGETVNASDWATAESELARPRTRSSARVLTSGARVGATKVSPSPNSALTCGPRPWSKRAG